MIDTKNIKDLSFIQNNRYLIKTEHGYKPFRGLITGKSNNIYEYKGNQYTGDHKVKIDNKWVEVKDIGTRVDTLIDVFEPLEVLDAHTYTTNNKLEHKNCLILDKICPFIS